MSRSDNAIHTGLQVMQKRPMRPLFLGHLAGGVERVRETRFVMRRENT